jgi:U3 small nucleolar RNA-associated protein 21
MIRVPSICTSLDMSPNGSFLATTHAHHVGIFLWANRTQFSHVPLRRVGPDDVVLPTALPTLLDDGEEGEDVEAIQQDQIVPQQVQFVYTTPDQLTSEMIMLSKQPFSKWNTLLNLETIKERNKPIEPPKQPEKAPFFLPTLPGVDLKFQPDVVQQQTEPESRILHMEYIQPKTALVQALEQVDDHAPLISLLTSLTPSSLDFEIRSLVSEPDQLAFLQGLQWCLENHVHYDLVQACLNVFIKAQTDTITSSHDIKLQLQQLAHHSRQEWQRLEALIHQTLCILDFARSSRI